MAFSYQYSEGVVMPEDIITLTVDTNDFYIIINSMRDDCGCRECLRVTNNLVTQRQEQYK